MIEIKETEVFGWKKAVKGMRNPKNSWNRSDSEFCLGAVALGEADLSLMKKLRNAGSDHGKFMRMITVYADITAPLYWWKEFDTYKIGTTANSCSTMHKLHSNPITIKDFSTEHLTPENIEVLKKLVSAIEVARDRYNTFMSKEIWWQMIQLLPTSYNQTRTVMMNYEVLRKMYTARKGHKLDEWQMFRQWIETLPYSELITGKESDNG